MKGHYYSASKGTHVDVSTMPYPHLKNAHAKLRAQIASSLEGGGATYDEHEALDGFEALSVEIARRDAAKGPPEGEVHDIDF